MHCKISVFIDIQDIKEWSKFQCSVFNGEFKKNHSPDGNLNPRPISISELNVMK